MKSRVTLAQEILKSKGLYNDKVDGIMGPNTLAALNSLNGLNKNWAARRKIIGCIQIACLEEGIEGVDVDGYWGHQTEFATEQLLFLMEHGRLPDNWRPEEHEVPNPNNWPVQYTPEFYDFYGKRGSSLVKIELPFEHKLSWNNNVTIRSFYCHEKVHDSLKSILEKVMDHYGVEEVKKLRLDQWGGCYNERPIRGGSKWSMHSWGIALDYDPARNKLKWGRDKASFARSEYNDWWRFWEEEGWISLGRERNFDWMHVQAAKLP
jgi:hypothetical protein